ncbi:MAG TPA: DUF4145 domain-containing protein [Polyangiaceae bacterium]
MPRSKESVKSYCERCRGTTNHKVLHEEERSFTPANIPEMAIDFYGEAHQIVECLGCNERSFRRVSVCSEDFDPETGEQAETVVAFPGEPAKTRDAMLVIKHFPYVPEKPKRIYREAMEAFNAELYTLAGGGLRAIVEAICLDKAVVDGPVEEKDAAGAPRTRRKNTLQGKIAGMAEKGLLTIPQANVLHAHRFMGNEALHELEMPDIDDLKIAIGIIEHTLETLYELEHRGALLTRGRI